MGVDGHRFQTILTSSLLFSSSNLCLNLSRNCCFRNPNVLTVRAESEIALHLELNLVSPVWTPAPLDNEMEDISMDIGVGDDLGTDRSLIAEILAACNISGSLLN